VVVLVVVEVVSEFKCVVCGHDVSCLRDGVLVCELCDSEVCEVE
jgi:hypothetical protein